MLAAFIGAVRIHILDIFAYRSVLLLWAIFDAIYPLTLIAIWLVVYQGQATVAGLTESQMLLYYVGVLIVTTTVSVHNEWDMSDDIRSGQLKLFLTKPLPYSLYVVIDAAVWRLYAASISIPLAFLIVWVLNVTLDLGAPYPLSVPFLIALVGAFGIFAAMSISLGFLAFFFERIAGLIHANAITRAILSGFLLPIALFPDWARDVISALPYPYMLDFPVQALIGTLTAEEFGRGFLLQLGWTAVFAAVAVVLWQLGIRRYDAPEQVGSGVEA